MSTDKDLIESLGGATKVAHELNYTVQRVQNWKVRGIPAKVKLARQDLFLQSQTGKAKKRRLEQNTELHTETSCAPSG